MSPNEARRIAWEIVCGFFDWFPQIGVACDGSPVRMLGEWGEGVREPTGYVCSPIAYSVRKEFR